MRLLIILFTTLPLATAANDVVSEETILDDGRRMLRQEIVVDAPLNDVWHVFTTSEGWESWAVAFANVDFRVGGIIETSYDPHAKPGDPANIRNKVLSYLPYRMLSIQAVQAPPGFPHAELLPNLHSVIEFEAVDESRTRVIINGVGYGEGEGYDRLLEFFRRGNAWTFEKLRQRFELGPVDWDKTRPMQ